MIERLKPVINLPATIGQLVFDKLRELTPVNIEEFNAYIEDTAKDYETT